MSCALHLNYPAPNGATCNTEIAARDTSVEGATFTARHDASTAPERFNMSHQSISHQVVSSSGGSYFHQYQANDQVTTPVHLEKTRMKLQAGLHYISANCVVVTHYVGDAATAVDEHFSRALGRAAQVAHLCGTPQHSYTSTMASQDRSCNYKHPPPTGWMGGYSPCVSGAYWNRSGSPQGTPLDLANPRGSCAFQPPPPPPLSSATQSEPESWHHQQSSSQNYHFSNLPLITGLESTEATHRDLFWY